MADFNKSKSIGKMAENLVINYFTLAGIEVSPNTNQETRSHYDLDFKLGNKKYTCEVKLDWLSYKTSNLAIEYENENTKEPSGLGITTATFWAVCIKDSENWVLFITKTDKLREYVKNHKGRVYIGAGDGNSNLLLYPVSEILSIFKRIDNIDASLIPGILKGLLK